MKQEICKSCGGSGYRYDAVEIGAKLRQARLDMGVGLREMARWLKFSANYLYIVETGKRRATANVIEGYEKELGCKVIGGKDAVPAASKAANGVVAGGKPRKRAGGQSKRKGEAVGEVVQGWPTPPPGIRCVITKPPGMANPDARVS